MTLSRVPAADSSAPTTAVPELLGQVAYQMSRRLEAALGPDGPTLEQWRVLALLADGTGRPMTEIAGHVRVPPPTLTKIVDRLVDRALVYRRADEVDRRRVLVFLSEHGRRTHARFAPAVAGVAEALVDELGAQDAARLAELLERLRTLPA
ncbi:MarR family winged helix-turn-helix transcriptional regulator [Pseudonocardia alaniniphila]|uniref:MarR family transcriptional regulator n=1 Tax=Pseudonocardia alaniniphila TaxID=75291 RepID=A0ABS9TU43_9PSEU|nr:MarR family transcriptional regulator [Pseudonocardia alaniniphila]MCH6171741.1 MarR family transcriptional regulator [Pseudonocardia alaniniphila]